MSRMARMCVRVMLLLSMTALTALNGTAKIKWYNPADAGEAVVQNQAWPGEVRESMYNRLPMRAQEKAGRNVWSLSRHSAGECIMFTTDARVIEVRYVVSGNKSMMHMPTTGVSGVDLYVRSHDGEELWSGAKYYSLGDTVKCRYGAPGMELDFDRNGAHTYTLYLPLYNEVTWMEIGVDDGDKFSFERAFEERPIVVYGTSIAHGACASRPGMAWTNILHRRMEHPVCNFGFSGSALFESGVIELLGEVDARAYIIDALPNAYSISPREALRDTIVKAVKRLRELRPEAPILLADHYGYPHGSTIKYWKEKEVYANGAQKEAYDSLVADGVANLYRIGYDEFGMSQDATVEGIHPSDYGMKLYADAYEKKLREILNEPIGELRTEVPLMQSRDSYNWIARHNQIIADGRKAKHFKRVIIGNSIVHHWGGVDNFPIKSGEKVWKKYLQGTFNMGCGWDRIENVLWRVYHGELDEFTADNIYLMIGTNNIGYSSEEEIVGGIENLMTAIRSRRPEARLTLIGIFPRANHEALVKRLNVGLENVARRQGVEFRNPGAALLLDSGKIDASLFRGGLHPNEAGYEKVVNGFLENRN